MPQEFFYHEWNLQGKINNNYGNKSDVFIKFKEKYYDPYKQNQSMINTIDKNSIIKKVKFLNKYYKKMDLFLEKKGWITTQSKIRSTVLEEFCGFLFKDLPIIKKLELDFFNKRVYAGVAINNEGKVFPKTKDIDFCIGKQIDVDFGGEKHTIIIPLIAIECKTWLDKTMFSEAQFTSQKLKQGTPNVKVYVLAGYSGIDKKEVPSKGQTPIDQVFLIGDTRIEVNKEAIWEFFQEIKADLERVTTISKIKDIGKLLPD